MISNHQKQRQRRQKGISLVEVLIATLVFTVALLGTLSLVSSEWRSVQMTQQRLYVNRILESRLEEVRDMTFDSLSAMPEIVEFSVLPAVTIREDLINPSIVDEEYEMDLHNVAGYASFEEFDENVIRVTLSVTWTPGHQAESETMKTVTLITRNGVGRQ